MSESLISDKIKKMTLAAMLLAISYIIPTLTQSIPSFNTWFSPMHLPVLIAGFVVGWKYGLLIGFLSPLLRAYTIGLPMPLVAWPMAFELATYGFLTGMMHHYLPKKLPYIYVNLIIVMLIGRTVNILSKIIILPIFGKSFVLLGAVESVLSTWPSFILNIILIPVILLSLQRTKIVKNLNI